VRLAPIRMSSLNIISSALAVRSPIANGVITHIATSTSRAPNLRRLRLDLLCFIFITFSISLCILEPREQREFP
jgi:hypothetical protein